MCFSNESFPRRAKIVELINAARSRLLYNIAHSDKGRRLFVFFFLTIPLLIVNGVSSSQLAPSRQPFPPGPELPSGIKKHCKTALHRLVLHPDTTMPWGFYCCNEKQLNKHYYADSRESCRREDVG